MIDLTTPDSNIIIVGQTYVIPDNFFQYDEEARIKIMDSIKYSMAEKIGIRMMEDGLIKFGEIDNSRSHPFFEAEATVIKDRKLLHGLTK